ncbi:hypothetical protein ADL15_03885 [Actinoplanes awajinensis subsp. mycoplanecinus]|uniref:Immunity protein 35 domain-containing protein n=1 Tax=Actinoplanes awajinensis subsp. mycoplanecinus TaxID=135947 RepID=A0A0X3V9I0_9ACTN|nr:hypothetical protein ADL15_03885 [Actinoplanes awajinensis subsp. mycoplanecinus]
MELAEARMRRDRESRPASAPELAVSEVEEHELGWIVHWASVDYLRTGDPQYRLGGGPYLVDRYDQSVHTIGTVASVTGDWVWRYVEQVWQVTLLDVLAERVRQVLSDEGFLSAMRHLRRTAPALTPAQAKIYVTCVEDGIELPPELVGLT